MAPTIVLVTGGNTGIGFETIKKLAQSQREYLLIVGGRSLAKVDAAIADIRTAVPDSKSRLAPLQIDIDNDESIAAAAKAVESEHGKLDVLVNNAGHSVDMKVHRGTLGLREGWTSMYNTNVIGTHITTQAFAPLLIKAGSGARLIFVTSGSASFAEMGNPDLPINKSPPAGWPKAEPRTTVGYRVSKIALNGLMAQWARLLANDDVVVHAVAPGFLATGLGGEDLKAFGAGEPSVGGESLRKVIEGERDDDAGKIVRNYSTPVQPW